MRKDEFDGFDLDLEGLDLAGLLEDDDDLELLELPTDEPKPQSKHQVKPVSPEPEEKPVRPKQAKVKKPAEEPRKESPAEEPAPGAPRKQAAPKKKAPQKEAAPKKEKAPKPPKKSRTREQIIRLAFNIIEGVLLVFLVVFVVWMFNKDTAKDVDMDVIHSEILENCELGELVEGDANTLKRYFSLDGAVYDSYIVYTADSVMNVEELLIVKTTDDSQLTDLREVVEKRVAEQIQNFDGYGTNQKDLLESSVILEQGDYFFYCVSEHVEQVEDTFLACIK